MAYQDWLFKDHPSGWRLRYRRNGGGYEASRDGERWIPVPSVTQVTGLLNKNLQEWAVRQVDLKTSSRVYPEHLLQVGAYALALRAEGLSVASGLVLALREGLSIAEVPLDEAAEAFLGLRRAFAFLQAL